MILQELAENIYVILSAYLLAFLPWTVLDSSDFIGPEWKSIAATRREGRIHLAVVMLPIMYIIFYIVVQAATRDFKEMFASFVALLFSIIHLIRTLWGLIQINELQRWISDSIQNLHMMGLHYKSSGMSHLPNQNPFELSENFLINETLVDNEITRGSTQTFLKYGSTSLRISKNSGNFLIQRALLIIRFCIVALQLVVDHINYLCTGVKYRKLRHIPHDPIEIWLRWSSAFIAQGFGHWVEGFVCVKQPEANLSSETSDIHRHFTRRRNYFAGEILSSAGAHLCSNYSPKEVPAKLFPASSVPLEKCKNLFLWEDWKSDSDVRDGRLTKNDLFINAVASGVGLPFSCPQFRVLDRNPNSKTVAENGYAPHAFRLERILESLPVEFGEEISKLDTFKLEWFAIILSLSSRAKFNLEEDKRGLLPEKFDVIRKHTDPALENLRDQLGFSNFIETDSTQPIDSVNISRLCSFPVPPECLNLRSDSNRLVTKAGELIDVWISLTIGEQYDFLFSIDDDWKRLFENCWSTSNNNSLIENDSISMFSLQKDVERARLMIQFANTNHRYGHLEQTITFMGYSMENVRSNLARWININRDTSSNTWKSRIGFPGENSLQSHNFIDISNIMHEFTSQVTNRSKKYYFSGKGIQNRLIWKLQNELQKEIDKNWNGPSSELLMMLCILSFPSLNVIVSEKNENNSEKRTHPFRHRAGKKSLYYNMKLDIMPSCAPQQLCVQIQVRTLTEGYTSARATLRRENASRDSHFHWELWRDAFTARLEAFSEWQKEHGIQHKVVGKSANSISGETKLMRTGSIGTGSTLRTWSGWIPFRFEFCRYEVEHQDFIKQYPRRKSYQFQFISQVHHEESIANFPGFTMRSFRYEESDPEYLMFACLVVQDYIGDTEQGVIETHEDLENEVKIMMENPRNYFRSGARKLHRAVIILEIAAVELGSPDALRACIKHLTENHHIACDIERAVGLLERCVAKFYIRTQQMSTAEPEEEQHFITKDHISMMYEYLMSKHGYNALVFWSYFKFLELMSSGDLSATSLQSTMRRIFMHTKDYDIVFELGQFPANSMIMAPGNHSGSFRGQKERKIQEIEFKFYERAISEGKSSKSMFELGKLYENGERGLQVDEIRAAALYHMAIDHGHNAGAKKALGDLYARGAPKLREREGDFAYALKMYWRAVSEDYDGEAMFELGNLYHFDERISNDPARAAALYQGAIIQMDEVRALRRLASMYSSGDGVSRNRALSVIFYQLAIDIWDDNDSRAQLALLLREGDENMEQDELRAQELHNYLRNQGIMTPTRRISFGT